MSSFSLSGPWDFRFEGDSDWREIDVPGCWESLEITPEEPPGETLGKSLDEYPGVPKNLPGPAWYRRTVEIPADFAGRRIWLCFDGVSYHCRVFVDRREVGSHIGIWDSFRFEISDSVTPGKRAEISVRVEKPAGLEGGPDSSDLPGRFPMRETLAGFLPYVWGSIFGGIWQDVRLEATGRVLIEHARIRGDDRGFFHTQLDCSEEANIELELIDPRGNRVYSQRQRGKAVSIEGSVPDPELWSPRSPSLYTAHFTVLGGQSGGEKAGVRSSLRFGFRTIRASGGRHAGSGATLTLNGAPVYPRMVLSWGWYPRSLHSNPGVDQVRSDWQVLKSMGFNGIKFCLWVPPAYFFDLADEMGMLLWLELPMWLPRVAERFRTQTRREYERIVRQACSHPSLVLYSLGCELNRDVDAGFLESLYRRVKSYAGDALVRDNSGSGEAYGGLVNEYADYYDYHFYCDLPFFRGLVDCFAPRWRKEQPWLFGEYCDSDTFRDLQKLYKAHGGEKPWWTVSDPLRNPQGARWMYETGEHERRLKEIGMWDRSPELESLSHRQSWLHRKVTLELTRTYREISGYVVTGERDTPVSTAGMFDDLGDTKFDAAGFRMFNRDILLTVGWDKKRGWIRGGDRAAFWDTFSYREGEVVRAHLICSHYGSAGGKASVRWEAALSDGTPFAEGNCRAGEPLDPGAVAAVCLAEFPAPEVGKPVQASLKAEIRIGGEASRNFWHLWFFPKDPWRQMEAFDLFDPSGKLEPLAAMAPVDSKTVSGTRIVVATEWSEDLDQCVDGGGRAVVLLECASVSADFPVVPMPFWREAVKIIEPHPAWGDFPHQGWVDLQFYSLAPDAALDCTRAPGASPLLRRLDARTMFLHDYAVEIPRGKGSVIASTLRFQGGLGDQAMDISRSPAAMHLLSCWIRYLQLRCPRQSR